MRILSICANLGRGGTQRVVQNFTLAYQRAGHDNAVLAWSEGGVRQSRFERAGIPVFIGLGSSTIQSARDFRPDIIHIHRAGVPDDSQTELMSQLKRPGTGVVETNVFSRVDRSRGAQLIDVHFQLTNWCMWKWRRWLGRQSRDCAGVVIANPVEPADFPAPTAAQVAEFRAAHQIPPEAFLCGRVGQADPLKWHPATFQAFASLAEQDATAHLIVLGLPPAYQSQIESLPQGIRDRIRILPTCDSDDTLRALYGSLDCFLHASITGESFGLVLTEAMLCGAPCVTVSRPYKDNSQIEVVRNEIDGWVAGSFKTFEPALRKMWEQRRPLDQRLPQLRAGVIQRYNADDVAAKALRVMGHLLEHQEKRKLLEALESDPELKTHTSDAEAMAMLDNTIGGPSRLDVLRMKLRHTPLMQRAAHLYLEMTLYRRLRKKFAPRPATRS